MMVVRWYIANLIIYAAVQSENLGSQLSSSGNESNLSSFFSDVLQKLEEIKETNSQNAPPFKRQLSEQSVAIEKLELKQKEIEGTLCNCPSLEEIKETGIKNGQVLQQLSNTIQQLQTKLSKIEQTLGKNMRLLLKYPPLNLGEMLLSAVKDNDVQPSASPLGTWRKRRI